MRLQPVATSLFTGHFKEATRNCSPVAISCGSVQLPVWVKSCNWTLKHYQQGSWHHLWWVWESRIVLTITADHGHVEQMINLETGALHMAHTTNKVPCARRCHAPNWFSAVNMDKDSQRPQWHYCDEWVQNDTRSFSAPGFTKAEEESR